MGYGGERILHFPAGGAERGREGKAVSAEMAVDKDLLQLDLYGLLGVGEKASEKEVRVRGPGTLMGLRGGGSDRGPLWSFPQERGLLPRSEGGSDVGLCLLLSGCLAERLLQPLF